MIRNPTVSIVIPVYNGANYLREAIDSALAQSYQRIEIIVVNDGSNDGGATEQIARSYGDRIRYFCKSNGGVASALNVGLEEMHGDYFSWLSHDDVYLPRKIETQLSFLNEIKRDAVLYSDYEMIDSQSRLIGSVRVGGIPPTAFRRALMVGYPIHGCSTLIPRKFFKDVGLFDESLLTTQDCSLWFRMAKDHDFIHMPYVLIRSRIHAEQTAKIIKARNLKECSEFYTKSLEEIFASWSDNCEKSKGGFALQSSIFLERAGYLFPANYASSEAITYFKNKDTSLSLNDWYWLLYYRLFKLKRILCRQRDSA